MAERVLPSKTLNVLNKLVHDNRFKWAELIVLFVGIPVGLWYIRFALGYMPGLLAAVLLGVLIIILTVLLVDKRFDRKRFGMNGFRRFGGILLRYAVVFAVATALVWWFAPENLFILPRENTQLWLLILVFYPLWSAYPQELLYRSFFFFRYRSLFPNKWVLIFVNALAFSLCHLMFMNWVALVGTFFASFLFAYTYQKSRSLLAVSIEHALYGNMIFTVGLGNFFYLGAGG